jgi:hypothetical protein
MKRLGGIIGVGLMLVQMLIALSPAIVRAENCADTSSYGAARIFLPEVSTRKQYALWVRMQSAQPTATVSLFHEPGDYCYEVTGATPTPNQWFWQPYQLNSATELITFSEDMGNSLLVIGTQDGIKVDKVLLTEPNCVPQDFGNNCKSGIEAISFNQSEVNVLAPPSSGSLSGTVSLSVTPTIVQNSLKELRYVVDGRVLQRFDHVESFDTTLVENGKHTVYIEIDLVGGTRIRESAVIDVENAETFISPLTRWVRLNGSVIRLAGMVTAGTFATLIVYSWFRSWVLNRRRLHNHGF